MSIPVGPQSFALSLIHNWPQVKPHKGPTSYTYPLSCVSAYLDCPYGVSWAGLFRLGHSATRLHGWVRFPCPRAGENLRRGYIEHQVHTVSCHHLHFPRHSNVSELPTILTLPYQHCPTSLRSHPKYLKMDSALILSRGLFNHNKDDSNSTSKRVCPVEDTTGPEIIPFIGNLTFHQFATILSGACAAFSALIVAILIALHAFNYSNPVQQRQIIRIVLLIPWVALFSFLIVWRDDAGDYLVESLDFGCSIALSSFLLFMCDLVLSHQGGFDDLFGQGAWSRGAFQGESPQWLKVKIRVLPLCPK